MISMLWSVIWERKWRALAIGVLTAIVVAIAVAAPAYVDASEQAMIRNEMSHATTSELSVSALYSPDLETGNSHQFETQDVPKLQNPYMDNIFGVNIDTMTDLLRPSGKPSVVAIPYLVFRQDSCAHVATIAGRCPVSTREIMVPQEFSEQSGLTAGSTVGLRWAKYDPVGGWIPLGQPVTMTVVGVYRPTSVGDHYWGGQDFFTQVTGDRNIASPFLTVRGTIDAVQHPQNELQVDDSFLKQDKVTPDAIPAIRKQVASMTTPDPTKPTTFGTSISALLDRIDHDRQTAQIAAAIAAVPLVLLGCLVLFLVTAYGLQDRRTEVGVVRLRGVRAASRWWLATGEVGVPAVAGVVAGVVCGLFATLLAASLTVPGHVSVSLGPSSRRALLYVLIAMFVALLAAHQRTLSSGVAELLRRVPSRAAGWRAATLEIAVVALAVAAVVQLKAQTGDLNGITLLAPGLVIIAIAVLAGRFVPAIASRIGISALASRGSRTGKARLGLGLGALQLARRPGAQRLMTVHVLAIGILTLTISAAAYQSSAQREQVRVQIGADRVLSIAAAPRNSLIEAVDKVDPDGRFAMLTTSVQANLPSDPPLLAVDSSRLATVAVWPKSSMSAAQAQALLQRPQPAPFQFTATVIELHVSAQPLPGSSAEYRVVIQVVPLSGVADAVTIDLGALQPGDHIYRGPAQVCASGCRISAIGVTTSRADSSGVSLVVKGMRTVSPVAGPVDLGLTDGSRWQPSVAGDGLLPQLTPGVDDLQMQVVTDTGGGILGAAAVNVNGKLPVIATGSLPRPTLGLLADKPASVSVVGTASVLPRLGDHGALVDLRTYDVNSGADTDVSSPEIWLNASAPKDILTRLKSAGILVTGERNQSTELSFTRLQGPSVGMRFDILVGVAAILLAVLGMILMAAVDRRSRAAELRVLRVQGLPAQTARRAAFVGHASIAVVAGAIGGLAALVSWLLVSARLPIFANGVGLVPLGLTPPWYAVVLPAVAGAVALAVTAAFAAQDVSTVVRRNEERGSAL